jgi:alcohol dehydrogenase class IV
MAGIAFSMAELSVTMAIAMAICSTSSISIENAMGVILPHIMEYNLTSSPGKYVQMSKVMDEDVKDITVIEAAIKAVEGVRKLEMEVDIPQRLSQFEIPKTELSAIAGIAINYPFLENAPRPLSKNEIETILIAAY